MLSQKKSEFSLNPPEVNMKPLHLQMEVQTSNRRFSLQGWDA